MNKAQKNVVIVGLVIAALMGLFPPWENSVYDNGHKITIAQGHEFIVTPPLGENRKGKPYPDNYQSDLTVSVDWDRLLLQWVIVFFLTAGAWVMAQSMLEKDQP